MIRNKETSVTGNYTKVGELICNYIEENQLKLDERLPGERQLSTDLKVSRSSLREAIKEMEHRGILRVEPGRGTFVDGDIRDFSMQIKVDERNFFDLLEIKSVLEKHIIKEITHTISDELLNQLESLAVQMNALAQVGIFPQELDDKFHLTMLELSPNLEMVKMIKNMMESLEKYNNEFYNRGEGITNQQGQSIFDTIPLHQEMVKCMKNRDANGAMGAYQKIIDLDVEIYGLV